MRSRPVVIWLVVVYGLIVSIVLIGGITRLTGSGLSMVDWHPLMGTLPPLDEQSWLGVFERYKQSPQYAQVNSWMTLGDFKRIFFWEYFHRLVARIIGLVFFVPWLVFVLRRRLRGRLAVRTALTFVLGGLQGLLGWVMVKSGLVDIPAVSHFRLAAHLLLALFVACWVLWIVLDLTAEREPPPLSARPGLARGAWALLALVVLQTFYGALMAGTRAGYMYLTFPDMNGELVPTGFGGMDPLSHPIAVHFIHRALGWLTLLAALAYWWRGRRRAATSRQRLAVYGVGGAAVLQFLLGMLTVIYNVPIVIAVAHQGAAVLLLSVTLFAAHAMRNPARVAALEHAHPAG